MSTILDRLITRKGAALVLPAVLLLGATIGIGRHALPAVAADAPALPVQLTQATTTNQTSTAAGPFSAEQKTAIEKIVKDYLLANPELMVEIQSALEAKMDSLQAERLKMALKESADEIFRRPNAPVAGNPSGDVTVVEFFDYNCGYCRRAFGDLAKLVQNDPKVKLVFKELPILSKGSEEASRVALAAKAQGRYWDMHRALISMRGEANEQTALKAAEKLGLDMTKLKADMDSPEVKNEIQTVHNLAQKLGIQGTPHFLVGDRAIPGAPQNLLDLINTNVAELRKTGCSSC